MKALDTNILVRFLTKGDEKQAAIVYKIFKKAETNKEVFFIPIFVLLETVWVLESVYEISPANILDALDALLLMPVCRFEALPTVQSFISSARHTKTDLSDILIGHSAQLSGCSAVLTLDRKAAKTSLFELLK